MCHCFVSEVRNLTCFFQLISLLSFCLSLNTPVAVFYFVNFMMMFCLPSSSIGPILWHLSTSFSVIPGSCRSLFIMPLTDFVTDASIDKSTVPCHLIFPVTHLSHGLQGLQYIISSSQEISPPAPSKEIIYY